MAGTRQNGRGRQSANRRVAVILASLAFCTDPAFAADKPAKSFRCSMKRPFAFDSDKIVKLPDNPLIDSKFVSFRTSPNSRFFQVFVSFELKGPIDAKRAVVAEIRLLDDHGKTIAADTYQCADMRGSAGREVMPGIRASSLQGIALSRWDKSLKNRVAEVDFEFKER